MEEMKELLEELRALLAERRLAALRTRLATCQAQDVAALWLELSEEERLLVYRLLPKETAAEVLVELTSEDRRALVAAFSDYELRSVLDELYFKELESYQLVKLVRRYYITNNFSS